VNGGPLRLELRTVLPVALLALVVLAIIIVELCGRDDADEPLAAGTPRPTIEEPATEEPDLTPPTAGPSPTARPATATATPAEIDEDAEARDGTRQFHLTGLAEALEEYEAAEGEFPGTNGAVQTLCVFEDIDAGCALLDVIDEIPEDPLGRNPENGYWYVSDGESFTLYARRESDAFEECDELPEFLEEQDVESALCVSGP
jgi:hypothetical protein